ncbi:MAG: hypothetical protein V2A79_15515 [Planctomycetota bacterium]
MNGLEPSLGQAPSSGAARVLRGWLPDIVVAAFIVMLWGCWLYPDVTRRRPVAFDTFRDAAGAQNVLAGRWFRDAMIADQTYWYAPLGPIVFAGISRLTGQPPLVAYATSILWLNVLLPIGWYALARWCWGRRAGVAAVLLVWLGSRWWSTHAAMPMTSTQGVILLMSVFLAWLVSLRRRRRWAVAVGVLLAACTWYHVLSGFLAAATLGFHALIGAGSSATDARRREPILRLLIVAGVGAPLVAPLAWHLLDLPKLNMFPIEFLAPQLLDPEFALQTGAWPIFPLALLGLVSAGRRLRQPAGLIVGYGLVALLGQGLGYLRLLADLRTPVLIPHEFQWNFQIAVGMLAAHGAERVAAWIADRIERRVSAGSPWQRLWHRLPACVSAGAWMPVPHRSWPLSPGAARRLWELLVLLVVVAVAVRKEARPALERQAYYWEPTGLSASSAKAVEWIWRHTGIDDVFLASERVNYRLVAGWTGRKLVCPPPGHLSVAVSFEQRARDRWRMLKTTDPVELRELLLEYDVRYVLLADEDLACWDRWQSWGLFDPVFRVGLLMVGRRRSVDAAEVQTPPALGDVD